MEQNKEKESRPQMTMCLYMKKYLMDRDLHSTVSDGSESYTDVYKLLMGAIVKAKGE